MFFNIFYNKIFCNFTLFNNGVYLNLNQLNLKKVNIFLPKKYDKRSDEFKDRAAESLPF